MASTITAGTTSGTALNFSADTSGVLSLQGTTMGAGGLGTGNASIMKNRIINGAMVISQRWGTTAVSDATNTNPYLVDRWSFYGDPASKVTLQQNQGSVTPPAGFVNYMGLTSSSAYTPAAGDAFRFQQIIEGFNIADLNWGTANAKTVTLSFWVRSSLTGTFGGALSNSALNRSYPFTFTISAANTWEYETITIAGDTSGTWSTDTGPGMICTWDLGSGSDRNATANTWSAGNYFRTSSCVDLIATNGATLYITGVQLEVGSVATPFERRPFTTELQLCQRYYCKTFDFATAPANNGGNNGMLMCGTISSGNYEPNAMWRFPVEMRADPTVTLYNPSTGTTGQWQGGGVTSSNARVGSGGSGGIVIDNTGTNLTGSNKWRIQAAASAEL